MKAEFEYSMKTQMPIVTQNSVARRTYARLLPVIACLLQAAAIAQQVTVQVPGTSQILLAGSSQFATVSGNDSSGRFALDTFEKNYPALVNLRLSPGQAIQFTASGQVDLDPNLQSSFRFASPIGTTQGLKLEGGYTARISGKQGSLVGVFVGDTFNQQLPSDANFLSAANRIAVLEPLLAQPFLIGDGTIPDGGQRTFIVPRSASKLYLGILDKPVSDNNGSFTATVSIVPLPPAMGLANPLTVLGVSNIMLTGATSGGSFRHLPFRDDDSAPVQSPAIIDLRPFQTSRIKIDATGSVDLDSRVIGVGPSGVAGTNATYQPGGPLSSNYPGQGLSGIVAPRGSLVGVFTGEQLSADLPLAFTSDFSTATTRNSVTVTPRLQQVFFVGNGRIATGTAKDFVVPGGATRLYLGVNEGDDDKTSDNYGSFLVTVSPSGTIIPTIAGVSNGAGGQPGVSPNSWVTIYGSNFAPASFTDNWSRSIVNGQLPTTLDGVGVNIGGQAAYVYFVSSGQINVLAPNVGSGPLSVTVTTSAGTSTPFAVNGQALSPAFFPWPGSYAVATRQDFSFAVKNGTFPTLTTIPAKPGEVIILWGTGFGATSPVAPAGTQVPPNSYPTANPVSVKIGNATAMVYGAALAPGFAGLYQIAIQIPASLADGDYPVVATVNGVQSPSLTTITVQR